MNKKTFLPFLLVPVAFIAVAATTYTITQLTLNTSPSDGTVIEVYDPSASPKSGKYLLTNLVTKSSATVLKGDGTQAGASDVTGTMFPVNSLTRYVFDGDSLTSSNGAWATYFQSQYLSGVPSVCISNVAVSGQTAWDMLYSRYTNYVQPNKPASGTNAYLFVWAGINDLYYNTNNQATIIATLSNYWKVAKADGFTLVAFTITDRTDFPSKITNQTDRAAINSWMRQSPMWDYLVDVDRFYPSSYSEWTIEGVHFNTNGSRTISDLAYQYVRKPRRSIESPASAFAPTYNAQNFYASGSASAPSISFIAEPGVGLARLSPGYIGICGAGDAVAISTGEIRVKSTSQLSFATGAASSTAAGTGLLQDSVGTLRVVTGYSGIGAMLASRKVSAKTADYSVLNTDSLAVFTNEGTTAIRNITLPGAAAGLTYTFIVQDTDGVTITAAAGDTIRIAASVSAAAGNITTTTVGNSVTLVAVNATEWIATAVVGTWTVN